MNLEQARRLYQIDQGEYYRIRAAERAANSFEDDGAERNFLTNSTKPRRKPVRKLVSPCGTNCLAGAEFMAAFEKRITVPETDFNQIFQSPDALVRRTVQFTLAPEFYDSATWYAQKLEIKPPVLSRRLMALMLVVDSVRLNQSAETGNEPEIWIADRYGGVLSDELARQATGKRTIDTEIPYWMIRAAHYCVGGTSNESTALYLSRAIAFGLDVLDVAYETSPEFDQPVCISVGSQLIPCKI